MRLFFTRKELKLRRKRTIAGIVCLALVAGIYWILTRPHKVEPEVPVWRGIWKVCSLPRGRM